MSEEREYVGDKLFTLKQASDGPYMQRMLARELPDLLGPGGRLRGLEVEVLRRRKQRCVLRYRLHGTDGEAGPRTLSLIGKVYKADGGSPVTQLMRALWDAGFDRAAPDRIAIPEVAAYLPRLSLLLQEEIGGVPVKEHLGRETAEAALRQMARALAKLHRTPVRPGPAFTLEDHLRRCHPRPQVLRERCPELRGAIDSILREATALERSYNGYEPVLIHGDFHMGQVHVDPERTWIIDFDACCVADPAADLGNVLVFLKGKARRGLDAERLTAAFVDEYCQHMPAEILRRVPLFEAVTHLRRACKRLRFADDGWRKKARKFIDDSLESLSGASR